MFAAASCGGSEINLESYATARERNLRVHLVGAPRIAWDAERGVTRVSLSFLARQPDQSPLDTSNSTYKLMSRGRALDVEVLQVQGATAPRVNLLYSLVLDATYSMLAHTPPAFQPMRSAAFTSVQRGHQVVDKAARGSFAWELFWFDDDLFHPDGIWRENDILSIPEPEQGHFTRLHGAVARALSLANASLEQRAAQTPGSWQHVMVVFSDGADNHSWVGGQPTDEVRTTQGLDYRKQSIAATNPEDVLETIRKQSNFTLHTIGLGDDPDQHKQLAAMAHAGHGTYQTMASKNNDLTSLSALFERVTREFTTIQTTEIDLPWPPGDYTLTVRVQANDKPQEGDLNLRMHVGDVDAKYISQ